MNYLYHLMHNDPSCFAKLLYIYIYWVKSVIMYWYTLLTSVFSVIKKLLYYGYDGFGKCKSYLMNTSCNYKLLNLIINNKFTIQIQQPNKNFESKFYFIQTYFINSNFKDWWIEFYFFRQYSSSYLPSLKC